MRVGMPAYSVSLRMHHTLAAAVVFRGEIAAGFAYFCDVFSCRWCVSCFRRCFLSVATQWTVRDHKAPGRPSLGSGTANPSHAWSHVVLQSGGLANPEVRISREEVPIQTGSEQQLRSVEFGKVARAAKVQASTSDGAGQCGLGGAISLEDADSEVL